MNSKVKELFDYVGKLIYRSDYVRSEELIELRNKISKAYRNITNGECNSDCNYYRYLKSHKNCYDCSNKYICKLWELLNSFDTYRSDFNKDTYYIGRFYATNCDRFVEREKNK